MRRTGVLAMVALLGAVVIACGGSGHDGGGQDTPGAGGPAGASADDGIDAAVPLPAGADIYHPPDALADGPPGSLVWYRELPRLGPARAWLTLLRSSDGDGNPTWVTASMYRPIGPAPRGGFPVLVWAHGTSGVADQCAPSRSGGQVPVIAQLLRAGFVVVAPDGTGLGPPGPAQYLVGLSEGHAVLDSAMAAGSLPGVDAGADVALWGYSSGGQATLFAAQEATEHAPGLHVLGTVAVAPVSDVERFAGQSTAFPLTFGYAFLTFGAWSQVYDHADLSTIFTSAVVDQVDLLDEECSDTIATHFALTPIEDLRTGDPGDTPPWPDLMRQNSVSGRRAEGPVLLVQGTEDPIIAPSSTEALARRLCEGGTRVDLRERPGQHEVIFEAAGDIAAWLARRAQGVPARSTCRS